MLGSASSRPGGALGADKLMIVKPSGSPHPRPRSAVGSYQLTLYKAVSRIPNHPVAAWKCLQLHGSELRTQTPNFGAMDQIFGSKCGAPV